jgi:hypothetical protein
MVLGAVRCMWRGYHDGHTVRGVSVCRSCGVKVRKVEGRWYATR